MLNSTLYPIKVLKIGFGDTQFVCPHFHRLILAIGGMQMEEICCSLCGIELTDKDPAYGLTGGTIDDDCSGFRIDSDSDWDVYCPDCMNVIDRMISTLRLTSPK
jgi:hypothetical protein